MMDESGQIPYWGENPPFRQADAKTEAIFQFLSGRRVCEHCHWGHFEIGKEAGRCGHPSAGYDRGIGRGSSCPLWAKRGEGIENPPGFRTTITPIPPGQSEGKWDYRVVVTRIADGSHLEEKVSGGMAVAERYAEKMKYQLFGDVLENPPGRVRAGQRFIFRRSGMDKVWREHCPDVEDGTPVVVTQLPSAPKPGTMGQVHISDARTGDFLGMCSMHSLSTQTDELERSGQVKMVKHNPGDVHIDISDTHNPPLEILSARTEKKPGGGATMYLHYRITTPMDSTKDVEKILKTLYPGWKAISHASIKAGTYPNVKHAYGVTLVKTPELIRRTASGQIDPRNDDEETMRMIEDDRVVRGNPPTDISGTHPGDPIRAGFWVPDKEREKVVSGDRALYGFLTLHHAGTVLKLLIDVTTDTIMGDRHTRVTGKRISVRLHQPEGIDQVGRVVAQFGAVIANDGNVVKTSAGFSRNPPGRVAGTEIYKDIVEIKAIKRDGKRYVHKFGLGSHIIGLPDGSILIESRKGKRLWKNFKQGG